MNHIHRILTAATLLLAATGVGFAGSQPVNVISNPVYYCNDVCQDKKDLRADYQKLHSEQADLRKDLIDIKQDRVKLAHDTVSNPGAVAADKIDLRKDLVDVRRDRQEISHTQRDIASDKQDLRNDH